MAKYGSSRATTSYKETTVLKPVKCLPGELVLQDAYFYLEMKLGALFELRLQSCLVLGSFVTKIFRLNHSTCCRVIAVA